MRQRAASLGASGGAHISTFHSLCVQILRRYADAAGIRPQLQHLRRFRPDPVRQGGHRRLRCSMRPALPPGRMLEAISTLKNKLIDAETFKQQADDFFSQALAKVYARYQKTPRRAQRARFRRPAHEGGAAAGERFDRLPRAGGPVPVPADRRVPGHEPRPVPARQGHRVAPRQHLRDGRSRTSRSTAGGGPISATSWPSRRTGPSATIVTLEENFRSTADILRAADKLIACNRNRKQKSLMPDADATRASSPSSAMRMRRRRPTPSRRRGSGAAWPRASPAGRSPSSTAINAMSRALEEAFIRHQVAVPGRARRRVLQPQGDSRRAGLSEGPGRIRRTRVALQRIINTPTRGIGKVTIEQDQRLRLPQRHPAVRRRPRNDRGSRA